MYHISYAISWTTAVYAEISIKNKNKKKQLYMYCVYMN